MSSKTLRLTIKRQFFDLIAAGQKKIEYREIKPHWITRLDGGRKYDEVFFLNGYRPDSPTMRVQCLGISRNCNYFEIHLGKILDIKN